MKIMNWRLPEGVVNARKNRSVTAALMIRTIEEAGTRDGQTGIPMTAIKGNKA
jgi:hypothetical protein